MTFALTSLDVKCQCDLLFFAGGSPEELTVPYSHLLLDMEEQEPLFYIIRKYK